MPRASHCFPFPLLRAFAAAALLAAALPATSGCDSSFDAFDGSTRYYSVFGFLDANAETQRVRVEALQDSMLGSPEPLDATVTLTNTATAETARLSQSISTLRGYDLHFFQTSELDVRPEETYRLTIERGSDGATSTATVKTPGDFPAPEVEGTLRCPPPSPTPTPSSVDVTVRGIERLGGAKAVFGTQEIGYMDKAEPLGEESFRFHVAHGGCLQAARFVVGAAGPGWPPFARNEQDGPGPVFALPAPGDPLPPAGAGNIENGVGFFGGVVIKTVRIPVAR